MWNFVKNKIKFAAPRALSPWQNELGLYIKPSCLYKWNSKIVISLCTSRRTHHMSPPQGRAFRKWMLHLQSLLGPCNWRQSYENKRLNLSFFLDFFLHLEVISGSSEWEGSVYQRSKFIEWSYTFCFCNQCISWDGIFGAQDHLVNQFLVLLNEDGVVFQPKKKIHNMILYTLLLALMQWLRVHS
jgi:hypothetical protein